MVLKVCIVCDELIENKEDQVNYDVFASFHKYDRDGLICDMVDKRIIVSFHKKCFKKYKKDEEKFGLYFTQEVGAKRIVIKSHETGNVYQFKN